jgi:cell division transport system ATP-binding protein
MIQVFHVSKEYGRYRHALTDVTFDVARGEFVFLTGPSGAGKTTLLKLLFRDELPTEGQIVVNGRNIGVLPHSKLPYFRRTVGIVFQDFKLIGRKTVFENVAFVQNILGTPLAEQKRRSYQVLRQVGLHYQMNAYPSELSGGEQQRVAIARALVNEPQLLLADEPTGNLDPALSEEIMHLFAEINVRGTTVMIATHDISLIRRMGKRVLTLERGRLREQEAPASLVVPPREAPFLPTA